MIINLGRIALGYIAIVYTLGYITLPSMLTSINKEKILKSPHTIQLTRIHDINLTTLECIISTS